MTKTLTKHWHVMLNSGAAVFQEKQFDDSFEAIELFLGLQRQIYGKSEDPAKSEYALMQFIEREDFTGVFVGKSLAVSLVACEQCQSPLRN